MKLSHTYFNQLVRIDICKYVFKDLVSSLKKIITIIKIIPKKRMRTTRTIITMIDLNHVYGDFWWSSKTDYLFIVQKLFVSKFSFLTLLRCSILFQNISLWIDHFTLANSVCPSIKNFFVAANIIGKIYF